MNEQQIRDDERRKVTDFLRLIASELRKVERDYDAGYLDVIIEKLLHPNWVKDTEGH
jgi:hypothetical protein